MSTSNFPFVFRVVDLIAQSDSGEIAQNSEPSIGVNPVNPMQLFAGTFGTGDQPFFVSNDGGATWSIIGAFKHGDKSIAWKVDGSAVLVAALIPSQPPSEDPDDTGPIDTFAGVGPVINHYVGTNQNDQPWIRTGPSNHVYVAFNDFANRGPGFESGTGDGKTASVLVSTDGGTNYTVNVIDKIGTMLQDDPAMRLAVNGDTVYAVFNRWVSPIEGGENGARFNTELVVVRSDDGGADHFDKLGSTGRESPPPPTLMAPRDRRSAT